MSVRTSHHINVAAVEAFLRDRNGAVARDMFRRGRRVESAAKRLLRSRKPGYDSGRLYGHVTTTLRVGRVPAAIVGVRGVRYVAWVHDGTGIYGPRHHRIVPVRASVLRFRPKGSTRFIFRKSVKGMRANPFLRDALRAGGGTSHT